LDQELVRPTRRVVPQVADIVPETKLRLRWLESLIGVLWVSLVFQLWPSLFWGMVGTIDVRNWSWTVVIIAHVVVLLCLIYAKSIRDS